MNDILELKREYNFQLARKWAIMDKIRLRSGSPDELAELDIAVASITVEIKRIDQKLHYLMFGGEITPETTAKPLERAENKNPVSKYAELLEVQNRILSAKDITINRLAAKCASQQMKLDKLRDTNSRLKSDLKKPFSQRIKV